jgi:hypothetical protein
MADEDVVGHGEACGRVGVSACRRVGVWACGRVGVWACRRVGVWACGRVGVSAWEWTQWRMRLARDSRLGVVLNSLYSLYSFLL